MTNEQAMARALELAAQSAGYVSPNPLVGCVILRNGRVVGEGRHHLYGGDHAEVDAVRNAGGNAEGATVVVNLEPCSHHGKTPPCADMLIERKVGRVVVGMMDPNPEVAGQGIERLRNAGIDVVTGVLEQESRWLNRYFSKYIVEKTPYVVLKAAQSLDGCIATASGQSFWITGEESRMLVHRMRSEIDAVVVGANTVRKDDPELTVRMVEGRHPKRVVLAPQLRLPADRKMFSTPLRAETIVVCTADVAASGTARELEDRGVVVLAIESDGTGILEPHAVLRVLGERGIASVLVEGGAVVHSAFMRAGAVDELRLFYAPIVIGNGLQTFGRLSTSTLEQAERFRLVDVARVGDDVLLTAVRPPSAG